MKLKVVIFFLFFTLSNLSFGQKAAENYKLSGTIADEASGKGLLKATVSILKRTDNKTLTGTTTDEKGYFTVENIPEKFVRVRISNIGYQTMIIDSMDLSESSRLGLLKLKSSAIVMPEIVIKSLKPMIEVHADKQVLNMDRLPGNSGSVTEALKNSGVVQVDPQTNKISVRGQDVKLQMDGHEYSMPSEMLAQMPAAMIDQAEVILAPGAKESAEGGTYILNLISKKNTFDNYSGSVNVGYSNPHSSRGGLSLNYKANKLNLFSQVYGFYSEYLSSNESERYTYNSTSMYYQRSQGESRNYNSMGYVKLGMDYDFNESNSMSLTGTYNKNMFSANSVSESIVKNKLELLQYGYKRDGLNDGSYNSLSLSGFYKKKFDSKGNDLTFDILYTSFGNPLDSKMNLDYSNRPGMPQLQNSSTGVDAQTLILRSDYALPVKLGKLEAGYSFTYRNRQNDYSVLDYSYLIHDWKDSMALSNTFKYKERINALYSTFSFKLDKFDIKAGLRAENLNTNGEQITTHSDFSESFLSLFPNLNVSYKLDEFFNLGFNTFRRVTYPQIYFINPFRQYRGPNSYSAGNPKLEPYYVNSYAFNVSQYINVYYVHSTGYFTSAVATENDSVLISSYINLNSGKTFGIDLTFPYYNTPMMPFHLPDFISMLNVQFSYLSRRQTGQFVTEDLSMTDNTYSVNANLGLKLWYDINANVYLYYRSGSENRISTSNGYKDLSLYFSKSFMDNKLRLNFSIYDILDWQKYESESFGSDYYLHSNFVSKYSRSVSIGITYMFNDFKERRERNIDDGRDGSNKGSF